MPYRDKPAFRCRSCGHLYGGEHAGERACPAACPVCGKGAIYGPGAHKSDPANWEVLADCPPERLAELGLTTDDVARHVPAGPGAVGGAAVAVALADGPRGADRAG